MSDKNRINEIDLEYLIEHGIAVDFTKLNPQSSAYDVSYTKELSDIEQNIIRQEQTRKILSEEMQIVAESLRKKDSQTTQENVKQEESSYQNKSQYLENKIKQDRQYQEDIEQKDNYQEQSAYQDSNYQEQKAYQDSNNQDDDYQERRVYQDSNNLDSNPEDNQDSNNLYQNSNSQEGFYQENAYEDYDDDYDDEVNMKKEIISIIITIAVAVLAAIVLNKFVLLNAKIPSSSMESTINPEDKLIANRLSYSFSEPKRGEIIIFEYPDDDSQIYIKRIIGLPGEKVEIKDGKVFINDSADPLEEIYIKEDAINTPGVYEVPENSYFVLGDNRNNSEDSRYWKNTYVSKKAILGKAILKYKPEIERIN